MKYCIYNAVSKTYLETTEIVYNVTPDTKVGGKDLKCVNTSCDKCGGGVAPGPGTPKYKCVSGVCQSGTSADYTYATLADCQAAGCAPPPPPPPPAPRSNYTDCTNEPYRKRGCIDRNGVIYKVQGCIGVKQDGKFGPRTEAALEAKTGKKLFSVDNVETICAGKSGSDSDASKVVRVAEPKIIPWETLIDNEQVYRDGYQYQLGDGTIVYMIKYQKGTDTKIPMKNGVNGNLDEHDIIALYPVKEGDKEGSYGMLQKYLTKNDEEKVKIVKDINFTWEVDEPIESVSISERKIRKIINKILKEQKLSGRPTTTTTNPNVSSDVNLKPQQNVSSAPGTTPAPTQGTTSGSVPQSNVPTNQSTSSLPQQNVEKKYNFSRDDCREKIKDLHLAAFPPRLRENKLEIEESEIPKIKDEIEWCVIKYPFGKVFGVKDELIDLMNCETDKFRKSNVGKCADSQNDDKCFCFVGKRLMTIEDNIKKEINESVVKRKMTSLLEEKRKVSNFISEAVVSKRKEKTRDVIAEDLIKMIKGY